MDIYRKQHIFARNLGQDGGQRVRTKAIMAAKSYKKMYGVKLFEI
jgi:hypothetical protein